MKLNFCGEIEGLNQGIEILSEELGITLGEDGIPVRVYKTDKNIEVELKDGQGSIGYNKKIHFFRGLGLFVESAKDKNSFKTVEEPQFESNGVMVDASRNAVMKVESIKIMLRKMALMGLNLVMMYTEDTYTVDNRPYFGYMRGRYSFDELKECDDYADIFGIEMVPCIQTLAHLTQALKWSYANEIKDTPDILLVGSHKTYEFIEDMIKSACGPFRSKRIHIGMDEAHNLGLGRYLDINGYRQRFQIMNEHLSRVISITSKYGLEPMIWSDMYFRLGSKTGDYYDLNSVIPQEVIDNVPEEVRLVYWDYYHIDEDFYVEFIKRHKRFKNAPIFAGGVWVWNGVCVNYKLSYATTNAALSACKKEGVKEVFATLWGDDGAETNVFSALIGLQLFAEHGYSKKVDMEKLKKRFEFCTGEKYDAFFDLTYCDEIAIENNSLRGMSNPSKYLLWQDVLLGLFDRDIEGLDVFEHYSKLEERLNEHSKSSKEWGILFEQQEKLCSVLKIKGDIGVRIKKYYDNKDMDSLKKVVEEELPELYNKVKELKYAHRDLWFKTYKPFGWEVIDIRYGGVLSRIDTAISRLTAFIEGKVEKIDELEEERLHFNDCDSKLPRCNQYARIASASPI